MSKANHRLDQILSNWQQLPFDQKPQLLNTFTAGLNHETHLLMLGKQKVVLKLFSHSQNIAIETQRWGHSIGVAPAVLFSNSESRFAVFDYIDAQTLSANTINNFEIKSLAIGLQKIHTSDYQLSEIGDFEIINFCNQYLNNITESGSFITGIHRQILPILEMYRNDKTAWAICHNDLVAENCFIVNDRAQFIDWEYAQRHNPWFDLAAIVYYLKLDTDQAKLLLSNYRNGWDKFFDSSIFYSSQCALLWGDMLWHLDHYGEGHWNSLAEKWRDLQALALKLNITLRK